MNLKTSLLPHQVDAVKKIEPSRIGALFMEMGTGKSRTAIELVHKRWKKIDKIVWFCPVSLKETIRQEIRKHTDCSDICVFNDKIDQQSIPTARWYIIGIESMSSSNRVALVANKLITEQTFVILDESSYIKGHRAKRTLRITEFSKRAKYRLILTGTPLSQGVVDLFAQMRFLSPKILGYDSFYSFAANHLEYSEKYPGRIVRSHNVKYLAAKIQPYTYQVTKAECLTLPRKLYDSYYFYMTDVQRYYYEMAKEEILSQILDDDYSSIAIFRLFSVLQQIVCGFWGQLEMSHFRIRALEEVLLRIPENEKVIIWAKYRRDILSITKMLDEKFGSSVSVFYGDVPEKKRAEKVELFKTANRFFVSTQSCGGHGLTLNEAHHVIFYNNAFKYSERLQAEDRCHRIGQEHPVTYVDIICADSIDERIDTVLATKGNVVEAFKAEVDKVKGDRVKELIKSL